MSEHTGKVGQVHCRNGKWTKESINPSFVFLHVVMDAPSARGLTNAVTQSRNKNVSAGPELYWI
jgi:hypothetical protein